MTKHTFKPLKIYMVYRESVLDSGSIILWYDAVIMTKEEIRTLGSLSRIALTEQEVEVFNQEIDSILEYVSTVKNIAESASDTKSLGARFNVLRTDAVTNEPGHYTKAMLAGMPATSGQFLAVKKILKQE